MKNKRKSEIKWNLDVGHYKIDTKILRDLRILWHDNLQGLRYLGSCRISSIQSSVHGLLMRAKARS